MKKLFVTAAALACLTAACQNAQDTNDAQALSAKAIEIHDLIMPQVSTFDKHTVLIDSLLGNLASLKAGNPSLDTNATREQLSTLKADLESATDNMMTWMKEYTPDSTDAAYQQAEVDRISQLKNAFEKATQDAERVLVPLTPHDK